MPSVSVIVPHFNDLLGLDKCLSALASQTLDAAEYEIIVADNNSPLDRIEIDKIIANRARLVIIEEKGAGPARNGGVEMALAPVIAFTDSDCIPDSRWLEEGLRGLELYDLVGGRVDVLVDDLEKLTPSEAFEKVFAFNFKRYIESENFTGAGNLFCRKSDFDQIGPFKVGLSEDKEWSHRGVAKGFSLGYVPTAIVGHPARRNWEELKRKWERIDYETYGLLEKTFKSKLFWALRSVVVLASIVPHGINIVTTTKIHGLTNKLAAFKILVLQRSWRFIHYWALLLR